MSCAADRVLDSPDSGLPPSPSPSAWLPPPPPLPLPADKGGMSPGSEDERRDLYRMDVLPQPRAQGLEHCSQTVVALAHSTWRRYKTQLDFQPRHRAHRFQSTTIVYPKHTHAVYTTELSYDCRRLARRFLASVELEAVDHRRLPQ
ncbi:hypothetical protein CRUP_020251 [Coryphaenoides rupestris]|nr:hypothetical protein CRUP_020251 [Coryphaenoides rupestris]